MRSRVLACGSIAVLLVALGPAQAYHAGYGTSYWEDADIDVRTMVATPFGARDGRDDCQPVKGTGDRPAIVVYPILNMYVINQCFVGASMAMLEGPVVLAGGLGHGRDMPSNVTITNEDGKSWNAVAVECKAPAGATDPPRVLAYPVLDTYRLDACSIVPGVDWDSFTVTLKVASEALG